ncbi:hypothetical protein V5799_021856 [Amblyomma americanum]|uniref:Uncharacterized protein n=1 Tax=Amblyomma americanum TaxID=6943 RepID=A0AAQ4DN22_AMBAM
MGAKTQLHGHPVSDFFSAESPSEDDASSSFTSSDEEPDELWYIREPPEDRTCTQALVIFTTITCVSIVLSLMFLDSVDEKLSQNTSRYSGGDQQRSSAYFKRRKYTLGERPEKSLLCTVGCNATDIKLYPPDGLCNWIVYTHVSYDAHNDTIAPVNSESWKFFLQMRSQYSLSRVLPSHEWTKLSLDARQSRSLNRTLTALRMAGLALLNVRIAQDQAVELSAALSTLAGANPGMFLVLGASFYGLTDRTASQLLPSWLLDQLVTPLSVFVLETHLPPPGDGCTAGFSTALQPAYGQRQESLTFRGARSFLEQPALRYANPATLARCVSVTAGVLVFHVMDGHRVELGAPCSHWWLDKLAAFCSLPSVSVNVEARAAYGNTTREFFSFETFECMWSKIDSMLRSLLNAELPTCLAVYSLDLDAPHGLCQFDQERRSRLVYTAYDVVRSVTVDSSSGDSLFASDAAGGSVNSTL